LASAGLSIVKSIAGAGGKVAEGVSDANGDGKTPKAKSLAQEKFPDMPKDKVIKAKAASDKEASISDIGKGKKSAKSLAETKEPVAMPPFTSGII